MSKRIYTVIVVLIAALAAFSITGAPELRRVVSYSLHDSLALVLCNPEQMYACGFGDNWNAFTGCYLAALICAGVFVYSNSYAYPEGFRMMSILRFGSEKQYWKHAMWRSLKNVLFAATIYVAAVFMLCAAVQYKSGFGAVRFVSYRQFTAVYWLFWFKLLAMLSLVAVFGEVFAQRLARAGIIGSIIIGVVLLLSVDVLQEKSALLVIGNWQMQAAAIIGFLVVQAALLLYGKVRPLRL
ncbi:MAG: hypothetical protein ACI3X2_12010 [Butyricicoccus porcorum]